MKNSTKFLDDIMKNSIYQHLVIDITDKPTFEDWWRFEDECLGTHFGMDKERNLGWWDFHFGSEISAYSVNNFILLEISIVDGEYIINYLEEASRVEDFDEPYVDTLIIPFSEIYNKYLLKPLPKTLGETKDNQAFLSQEELDELLDIASQAEGMTLGDELKEVYEQIALLNSTIKDMEEIIQRYEHNLTFTWAMLEQKIKETK